MLQGRGLKTSAVYYEVQAVHGMPAHQTVWPPGLALLAASLAWVTGLSPERALAVLNAVAHGTSSLLLYWIATQLRGSRLAAGCLALAYLLYAPSLVQALSGVSEPLSVLATVAAAACVTKAFAGEDAPDLRWLAGAAALIGLGSWVRYQVIFQVAPLGLICLIALWRREAWLRAGLMSSLVVAPAVVAFFALLLRNWLLVGSATGANSAARGNSIAELAFQAKWAVLSYLGGGAGPLDRLAIVVLAVAAIAGLVLVWRRGFEWQVTGPTANAMVGAYALTSSLITTVIIVIMASRTTFYTLEGRYFHGAVLLGVIALIAYWPRGFWRAADAPSVWAGRAFMAAGIVLILLQLSSLAGLMRRGGEPVAIRQVLTTPYEGRALADFLRASGSASSPLMSNQSQLLHLVLGVPTFSVPERRLTPRVWSGNEIIEAARRFGVEYVVVFRKMPLGSSDGSTDYVWQMAGTPPADLVPLLVNDELSLYRIGTK